MSELVASGDSISRSYEICHADETRGSGVACKRDLCDLILLSASAWEKRLRFVLK